VCAFVRDGESNLFKFCIFSHINQTSSWLPPIDNWNGSSIQLQSSTVDGASAAAATAAGPPLPYGWEAATDRDGRAYFIKSVFITFLNFFELDFFFK